MKTIRQGDGKPHWWAGRKATCKECGSVVELEHEDVPIVSVAAVRVGVTFVCPHCTGDIDVYQDES